MSKHELRYYLMESHQHLINSAFANMAASSTTRAVAKGWILNSQNGYKVRLVQVNSLA